LLDVNKIHFILACGDDKKMEDKLLERMNFYRGNEFDFPSNEELLKEWEKPNRFDTKETIFVKRILQTVLPEKLRGIISSEMFNEFVGIEESKFARELYMTRDQIRCMRQNGMFIGLHGYDHYWLGRLGEEYMKDDLAKALDVMGEFIDPTEWVMNYPYGDSNPDVIKYIQSKGCALGLTTEVRVCDMSKDNRFLLPRLDCNDFPPKSNNWESMTTETTEKE